MSQSITLNVVFFSLCFNGSCGHDIVIKLPFIFHLYTFHEPLAVLLNTVKRGSITNIDVKHNNVKLLIVNISKSGDDDIKF